MNKKFLLAAVMGCTMALGFSGCSDDDEDNGKGGNWQQTYYLKINNTADDSLAMATISSAYNEATNQNEDSLTIRGKDSVDCDNQFLALMTKAEKALADKKFDSNTLVMGYTEQNDSLYTKLYGDAENITLNNQAHLFTYNVNFKKSIGQGLTEEGLFEIYPYISEMRIFKAKNFWKESGWESESNAIAYANLYSTDINSNLGGKYVHITAKVTDNADEAIRSVILLVDNLGMYHPEKVMIEGHEYSRCSEECLTSGISNCDQLYLYASKDTSFNRILSSYHNAICERGGYSFNLKKGYYWKSADTTLSDYLHIVDVYDALQHGLTPEFVKGAVTDQYGQYYTICSAGMCLHHGLNGKYNYLMLNWKAY